VVLHRRHDGDAVDMTRDIVAAERLSCTECFLEVDARTLSKLTERRDGQRLARDVCTETSALDARGREAASIHADAVAHRYAVEAKRTRIEHQLRVAAFR